MAKLPLCSNCSGHHKSLDGRAPCFLALFFRHLVREREELTHTKAMDRIAQINADAFWDDVGVILDRLAEGYYDSKE